MSQPSLTLSVDLADGAQSPSTGFPPTNQRVTSRNMPLSVQTDVPLFNGASSVNGTWMMAGTRVTATAIGVINGSSIGVGYSPVGAPSGPLQIRPGNQNVTLKF